MQELLTVMVTMNEEDGDGNGEETDMFRMNSVAVGGGLRGKVGAQEHDDDDDA